MPKDAFYFTHDSNARNDPKIIKLRRLAGLEAYGLFWCILEMLRESSGYRLPLESSSDIVYELRTSDKAFEALFTCGLLQKDTEYFWSDSLNRRMVPLEAKREQLRLAGIESGKKRKRLLSCSSEPERMLNVCSTDVQRSLSVGSTGDERILTSKVKENIIDKVNESIQSELPFGDLAKEFGIASQGRKTYQHFDIEAKMELTRIYNTMIENKYKNPLIAIKAVIHQAMKEMLEDYTKTGRIQIYFEPRYIFQEVNFNRYLSTADKSKFINANVPDPAKP